MGSYTFYADRPVEKYRLTDKGLLVSILLLWGIGFFNLCICTLSKATTLMDNKYHFIEKQLINSGVGFAGLLFFALFPIEKIRKILPAIVLGTLVLCLMTFFPGIGVELKGARRWIKIPFLSTFQPSEAAKFAVVLFLSNLFEKQSRISDDSQKRVFPAIIGLVTFVIIIFAQKDFSTGLFIFVVGLIMFFATGAKLAWLAPFTALAVPAAILMITIEPYRLKRVIAFFNPSEYQHTIGYQQFAAERAISAGGIWGNGFGSGLSKINSIPEIQADYIFAGWIEATGYFGVIVYFIILGLFTYRAIKTCISTPDKFAAFGSFGCTMMLVLQSIFNCAVVCGAVPTTGIPLPFFSSGGSSIIVSLCMCGFILNASHCDAPDPNYNDGLNNENFDEIEKLDEVMVLHE